LHRAPPDLRHGHARGVVIEHQPADVPVVSIPRPRSAPPGAGFVAHGGAAPHHRRIGELVDQRSLAGASQVGRRGTSDGCGVALERCLAGAQPAGGDGAVAIRIDDQMVEPAGRRVEHHADKRQALAAAVQDGAPKPAFTSHGDRLLPGQTVLRLLASAAWHKMGHAQDRARHAV
jgi:hypothetical protein